MRPLNKILFLITIVISFFISGCYTVLWTPEEELPNESTYQQDSGSAYYNDDYYYYYDYPWWLTASYPVTNMNDNNTNERNRDINALRNTGDGRGTPDRRDVLIPPPATINDNTNTNSNNNSNNTNTNQNTEVRKSTSSSNTNSNNNSARQSSGNNSSIRNSSGDRNNGGGRK